jgi:sec-independent protein translocase protein TatA
MPFNLSPLELIFVLAVLLLLFGAKRLPDLGSGLGKGIREFKRSIRDVSEEINRPEQPAGQIQDPAARPQASQSQVETESVRRDG